MPIPTKYVHKLPSNPHLFDHRIPFCNRRQIDSRFSRSYFAISNMGDRFQVLFGTALQDYERQTGTTLARGPLAERFERCNSVGSVVDILQEQARTLGEPQGGGESRIMRSLKCVVSVLYSLSSSTILGGVVGLVVRPKVLIGTLHS